MKNDVAKSVLVVGGAGYIGSHAAKALAAQGYRPVVFDNLASGHRQAVRWGPFVHGDIRDEALLRETMDSFAIGAVMHFASLIEVGRSLVRPDLFYQHNVVGTASLLSAMRASAVKRLVFSSSAAVYGSPADVGRLTRLSEDMPKVPLSPYGDTKLACERMIAAHALAFGLRATALRYFNAAGADPSAVIGEAHDPETHLIPLAIEACLGAQALTVFGINFPTPDGSCLRDYVHVNDLARAHIAALEAQSDPGNFQALNVGGGAGHSVLEVIAAVERETGQPSHFRVGAARDGDPASLVADTRQIGEVLGWRPERSDLEIIVRDAVRWRRSRRFSPAEASRTAA